VILVDAGPLVAILDRDDQDHRACAAALERLAVPLVTTWPAMTEAMYILGERTGWASQVYLWSLVLRRDLLLHHLEEPALRRSRDLMHTYRNVPMDLADATLVAAAEELGQRRIFTLDTDFRVYRLKGRRAFEIIP
jgi:predicted nucleic acid-binding protein